MATQFLSIFSPGKGIATPYDGTTIANLDGTPMTANGNGVAFGQPYTVPNGVHRVEVLVDRVTRIQVDYTPPGVVVVAPGSGSTVQAVPPNDLINFGDGFDRVDATSPGNGWTDVTASNWQLATQVLKPVGATGGTSAVWRTNALLDPMGNVGDCIVHFNVDITGMTTGAVTPLMAYQPGGGTSGNGPGYYALQITPGSIRWAKKAVGSADGLAYITTAASNAGIAGNIRVSVKKTTTGGVTTLDVRVRDSTRKIILDFGGYLVTDSEATLQGSGQNGLLAWAQTATVAKFYSYLVERTVPTVYNLVCEGDSITAGSAASDVSFDWYYLLRDSLGPQYQMVNLGSAGQKALTMRDNAATRAAANYVAGKKNIMLLYAGINDFGLIGDSAANVAGYHAAIHAAWQAAGFTTIDCTLLSADHVRENYVAGVGAKVRTLNDSIRTNALTAWGCKGLVEDAADARFGQVGHEHLRDFFAFQDELHPVDLTHALMCGNRAPIVRQVAALL